MRGVLHTLLHPRARRSLMPSDTMRLCVAWQLGATMRTIDAEDHDHWCVD
jgi:hypothetical protein